jgi:hypothetical protein
MQLAPQHDQSRGLIMKLTLLGSETKDGGSPALYATDRGTLVVQGWRVTDPDARTVLANMPAHEDVLEIPPALLRFAPAEHS